MGLFQSLGRVFNRGPNSRASVAPLPPLPFERKDLAGHLAPGGTKRILALDGGGVRGAMSIAILERIENILRARHGGHPDFRLCDYFDLVGGTSTGSIIAAGLTAKRMSATEIAAMYDQLAGDVFKSRFLAFGATRAKFKASNLRRQLEAVFGDMKLGDEGFASGFAAVAKRIDTVSPWVMHNNPRGRYFNDPPDQAYLGNKHFELTQIVRASAAAPMYFDPERLEIAPGVFGEFIDGGLTPHNNPAFQLLMLAGLKGHNYGWTLDADHLFMISIGTGSMIEKSVERPGFFGRLSGARALKALMTMISSSEDFIELLMQWASNGADPKVIDSEIGDLAGDLLGDKALLSYERYQCSLDRAYLRSELGLSLSERQMRLLREMTNADAVPIAREVGMAMAERYVREEHFPARFDLPAPATA